MFSTRYPPIRIGAFVAFLPGVGAIILALANHVRLLCLRMAQASNRCKGTKNI